jgi:hypothetical protein
MVQTVNDFAPDPTQPARTQPKGKRESMRSQLANLDRTIRKRTLALMLLCFTVAIPASAQTWKNVMLLDVMCSKLDRVMNNPPDHPRACILECHDDGYGVVLSNGDFVKFDAAGSRMAIDVLRSDDAPDQNVRVNVSGKLKDGVIEVKRITLIKSGRQG